MCMFNLKFGLTWRDFSDGFHFRIVIQAHVNKNTIDHKSALITNINTQSIAKTEISFTNHTTYNYRH